jgi:cbb3-type cytochrome oxidase subunit 3
MTESEIVFYKILGLIIFMSIFLYAVFYAYRPKNKKKFEEIAEKILEE